MKLVNPFTPRGLCLGTTLGVGLAAAAPAPAVFVLVEDFDGLATGALVGQTGLNGNPYVQGSGADDVVVAPGPADPDFGRLTNAATHNIGAGVPDSGVALALTPETAIAPGSSGTIFFRLFLPANPGGASSPSFGLGVSNSNDAIETINTDAQLTGGVFTEGFGAFQPRQLNTSGGGGPGTIAVPGDDGVWNNYWIVFDNNAGVTTYDVYHSLGADDAPGAPSQTTSIRDFAATEPLGDATIDVLFIGAGGGPSNDSATVRAFVDDVFIDNDAVNLVNPVPEPGSMMLLAGGALLVARRRRAA